MAYVRAPMGKQLVITEKPSVARDIVSVLGGFSDEEGFWESDDFVVTYAVGHLFELLPPEEVDEKYKRWTLDTLPILPEKWSTRPKSGTSERVRTIKKLLKRDDIEAIINACDAGREGELIFREITEYFEAPQPMKRLWLQSMTKGAILKGFSSLEDGRSYDGLSAAAHCRNYSDWVIGMNATRALTRRLKTRSENQAWSAGRVQTPTLAMLVERELEILAHDPKPFWRIKAKFLHQGDFYTGVWFDPSFKATEEGKEAGFREDRIFDEEKANALLSQVKNGSPLASETRKPSREAAPGLFDLTTLQREANRRFGWSARRTLNAAQRCYEGHKVLTYPRTDSKALPEDYRATVDELLGQLEASGDFGKSAKQLRSQGLLNADKIFDDSKVSDHFAIVPTGVLSGELSGDDARLFDLVSRRFLAAFFPPAEWSRIERTTVVEGESFRTRARTLQVPGWRSVFDEEKGSGASEILHELSPGNDTAKDVPVKGEEYTLEAEETKPPPRITEARLLSLMENAGKYVDDEEAAEAMAEKGIGTPATRADTIENLISKGYVLRAGRGLRPSVKGVRLIDILGRMKAGRIASPKLTGELEHRLNKVEDGAHTLDAFMKEIYDYAREIVDLTVHFEFEDLYPDDESLGACPLCEKNVFERSWFYRCKEPPGLPKKRPKKGDPPPDVIDCEFRVWKDKSGRYIDRRTVRELLADGKSRPLDGFMTMQGRTYRGELYIEDGELQMKRLEGGEEEGELGLPEYEVDQRPLGQCPNCADGEVVETRATFICSKGLAALKKLEKDEITLYPLKKRELKELPEDFAYCTFLLPRTVCKREITRDEAVGYIENKKTEIFSDFISKRGRPFSAFLFLKETGRHGFEFPPRGGAKDGEAKTSKKKTTKKKTAKKKATKKKSAKKKVAKKKSSKKKSSKKKSSKKKATTKKATNKKASKKEVDPASGSQTDSTSGSE